MTKELWNPLSGQIINPKDYAEIIKEMEAMQELATEIENYQKKLKEIILSKMDNENIKTLSGELFDINFEQRKITEYNYNAVVEVFEKYDLLDEVLKPVVGKVNKHLTEMLKEGTLEEGDSIKIHSTKTESWSKPYIKLTKRKEK